MISPFSKAGIFLEGKRGIGVGPLDSTMIRNDPKKKTSRSVQFKSPKVGWGSEYHFQPEGTKKMVAGLGYWNTYLVKWNRDLTRVLGPQKVAFRKGNPLLFQGNLGWWNCIICPPTPGFNGHPPRIQSPPGWHETFLGWPGIPTTKPTHLGVNPKIGVGPPNHPIFNRIFHYFHHPFSGTPIFGNTHLWLESWGPRRPNLYHLERMRHGPLHLATESLGVAWSCAMRIL